VTRRRSPAVVLAGRRSLAVVLAGRRSLAVVLAGCLAATACGGHAVTKKDVIARANAICINALRAVRSVPPPAGATGSPAALAAYLQKVAPIIETEASATKALPRPAQDRVLLNRYVTALADGATQYRALSAAAKHGDSAGFAHALAVLRESPAPALAARYGLNRCNASAGTGVP
jgi:hypothetical protein